MKFRYRSYLLIELFVGIFVFTVVVTLSARVIAEQYLDMKTMYRRAMIMQLVDGELESLSAGGWKSLQYGKHKYIIQSPVLKNLPVGGFYTTLNEEALILEWKGKDQKLSLSRKVIRQ